MNKHLMWGILAMGFAGVAAAESPDGEWRGVAGASLAATSGNSSNRALLVNLDVARLTTVDKSAVSAYVNEGKSRTKGVSSTTSGKWGLAGQYDHNLTQAVFGFGKLGFEHDRVIDLSLRTLLGAGLGYHVIQTKADTFDVFGGVSHVVSRYSTDQTIGGATGRNFSSTGLLLGEESSHQLTETTYLKQRVEYYPGLTGDKAQLLKLNASLNVAITKTTSLAVGLIDSYNSKPANGQKRNDAALFTGVNVKLGS